MFQKGKKKGRKKAEGGGGGEEREKENIHIRLENPNGRKNTKGN